MKDLESATANPAFPFSDDLGPFRVIHIYEPRIGLRAALVVDNVAAGPAIGGLRMAPDVSTAECFRLARAMTLKNAAAGLPHGGGKSVLWGDPGMPPDRKETLIRAFASAIGSEETYIPGPDMGTNEQSMAWVRDEIGRAVGLPREIGGIPLDEIGATALGLRGRRGWPVISQASGSTAHAWPCRDLGPWESMRRGFWKKKAPGQSAWRIPEAQSRIPGD